MPQDRDVMAGGGALRPVGGIPYRFPGAFLQCVLDADGTISYRAVGGETLTLFGLAPGFIEADVEALYARMHPADRAAWPAALQRSAEMMCRLNCELRMADADGRERWVRVSGSPRLEAASAVVWDAVAFDVTDSKRTERDLRDAKDATTEALRRSEARYRSLVEDISDWVWEVDAEGRYTYSNRVIFDMLGYRPEEILGRTPFDLMPPEESQRIRGIFADLVRRRSPFANLENINLAKDGRLVMLETSGVPQFDATGEFAGYRGIDRNITERKRAEAARRSIKLMLEATVRERTSELAEANRRLTTALATAERATRDAIKANEVKMRFLAAANHDLRQPMQAVRLFVEVLHGRLADSKDQYIIGRAVEALEAGEAMLRALVDIFSLDAGIVKPAFEAVAVQPLLAQAVDTADRLSQGRNDVRLVPAAARVRSDPLLLQRILDNLVGNAVAHGGKKILLGCRKASGALNVEVWDDGAGIPPEEIESIFEDFYQLGNPERDRAKGLGLGLPAARRLAALLGHDLSVHSWPGRGTVFSVRVPLA